ncbi:MAG: hypothetical protein DHS20C15_31090 [Planctomycetota bacterium]|nr:MAG: hypothetical protein DHS20C15_31090 [Planctomycetota bacterium]
MRPLLILLALGAGLVAFQLRVPELVREQLSAAGFEDHLGPFGPERVQRDAQVLRAMLENGEVQRAAESAPDRHLAFDTALGELMSRGAKRPAELGQRVLRLSPLAMPRSFAQGREPSGWDLATSAALYSGTLTERLERLQRLTGLLSPDIWKVSAGLAELEALSAEADDPSVAMAVFHAADRVAPFDKYRAQLTGMLNAHRAAAREPWARHLAALGLLRTRQAARDTFGPLDRELWDDAADFADSERTQRRARLAGLRDAWLRGAPDSWDDVQNELDALDANWALQQHEERLRLIELRLRFAAWRGELTLALQVLDELDALDLSGNELAANALVLARTAFDQELLRGAEPRDAVRERLHALSRLPSAHDYAAALHWELALIEDLAEDHDAQFEHLRAAAEPALAGARAVPEPKHSRTWWTPLDPRAAHQIDPAEGSQSAAWTLANAAYDEQRWADALRYFEPGWPGHGCGNVTRDAETLRHTRMARCLVQLGRAAEASSSLRALLSEPLPWDAAPSASFALVRADVAAGKDDTLETFLESAPLDEIIVSKALALRDLLRARRDGDTARAESAHTALLARWPGDAELLAAASDESDA